MNLVTKMIVKGDKRNQLNLPKDFVLTLHLAPYTLKKQNVK